ASEVDYVLQLTHELQYLKSDRYEKLVYQLVEIRKMLIAFIKPLRLK
ncbi:MAG: four helix bundle protein, partial [Candidatus Marinimicrobia bacterium]|nr:four helix bundle protein [Candidatus Neomarinimicrobiota bacterium]